MMIPDSGLLFGGHPVYCLCIVFFNFMQVLIGLLSVKLKCIAVVYVK